MDGWYTVALKNKLTSADSTFFGFNVAARDKIAYKIFDYFKLIRDASAARGNLLVQAGFTHTAAVLSPYDLVCYFVRDPSKSILAKHGVEVPVSSTHGGYTADIGGRRVSEVYVENNFPPLKLANICMHELMHNKLQWGNQTLHSAGRGVNQVPTTEWRELTPDNIRAMARVLTHSLPQYTAEM